MSQLNDAHEVLAAALAAARLGGHVIDPPQFELGPDAGYAVQERVAAHLGGPFAGWKVGSTSAEAQARLGTDQPGAGRMPSRFVFGDGADVPVHVAHDVQVEVEFAFRIGRTLAPRDTPAERADVLAAIDAFVPGMEIVGSRFSTGLAGGGRALVTADGGANIAFVGGAPRPLPAPQTLPAHRCALLVNGAQVAEGEGARALGDPVVVLTWLANHLSARRIALEAGEVVTTGTCTGLVAVGPGDHLQADFGTLGSVAATLVAASSEAAGEGAE